MNQGGRDLIRQKKSLIYTPVSWQWAATEGNTGDRERLVTFDYMLGFGFKLCLSVAAALQRTNLRVTVPSLNHAPADNVYLEKTTIQICLSSQAGCPQLQDAYMCRQHPFAQIHYR